MNDGRVVAAEALANSGKGTLGNFATEIHCHLTAEGYVLRAPFGFEIGQPDMKEICDDALDCFDIGFAFMGANQIAQRLAREVYAHG